jgi:hypothetical protein
VEIAGHRAELPDFFVALSIVDEAQAGDDKAFMDIKATTSWVDDFHSCSSCKLVNCFLKDHQQGVFPHERFLYVLPSWERQ